MPGSCRQWPDSIECEHSSGRDRFTVSRAERPLGRLEESYPAADCRLRDNDFDTEGPLRVRTDRPLGVPETITHNGAEYRYLGRFNLPEPIGGTVACEGEATLLSRVPTGRS